MENGRWHIKLLGPCYFHHWGVWEELYLLFVYCRVFQHSIKYPRHTFGTHRSCECLETMLWETIQYPTHIKYDSCHWEHVIPRHAAEAVSILVWWSLVALHILLSVFLCRLGIFLPSLMRKKLLFLFPWWTSSCFVYQVESVTVFLYRIGTDFYSQWERHMHYNASGGCCPCKQSVYELTKKWTNFLMKDNHPFNYCLNHPKYLLKITGGKHFPEIQKKMVTETYF